MSLYFEDMEVGQKFVTKGRTVTETDIVNFAGLSGDFNRLHTDAEWAKNAQFGARVAHGLLGLAIATGLSQQLGHTSGTVVAFLGMSWRLVKPIYIGDTIHEEQTVMEKRVSKKGQGIVTLHCEIKNQRGEVVQEGERTIMLARKQEGHKQQS